MLTAIKIIIMLAVFLVLAYPLVPFSLKLSRFSTSRALTYQAPHNKKNIAFTVIAAAVFAVMALIVRLLSGTVNFIYGIPFVGRLLEDAVNRLNSQVDFILFAIKLVLVNLIILYAFILLKAFFKKLILDPIFGLTPKRMSRTERKERRRLARAEKRSKKKKGFLFFGKKKGEPEEDTDDTRDTEKTPEEIERDKELERKRRRLRIPDFIHTDGEEPEEGDDGKGEGKTGENDDGKETDGEPTDKKPPRERSAVARWFLGLFFEGDDFEFVRDWAARLRTVLQIFVWSLEVIYTLLIVAVMASALFPLPMWAYNLLINVLQIRLWYVYPAATIIFLQEVCNVFNAPTAEEAAAAERAKKQETEEERREARLKALQSELKKRFDAEHVLRYYPECINDKIEEYQCTNVPYASALQYIQKSMQQTSGKVVYSYMEFLDAIFGDDNVYFAASFYSELGEYLIAYTYIRLLAGARMIFVVSDRDERMSLKKYISERLMRMTGSSAACNWRVYTSEERLDQADVFIASAEDFRDDNIVEQYPGFFEEACNAVFIDADRTIALDSYLCPVMASRLQRASSGRIRFIFLTLDLLKGFAAGSLPKFFCIEKVLSFSSAKESEAVAYTLWNKESKNHRIYNKNGQKLTNLECIIADLAFRYGVDGVRVITEAALDHAEKKILSMHDVEINKLYKGVADVNYMIYSDERCNMAAALYACCRFRGRKKSVVHILSKPYLLREYFMAKVGTEEYINRSSFIQPRVTEHAERYKLSLLRIFCDASAERGIPISQFEERMKTAIRVSKERNDLITSAYCRKVLEERDIDTLKINELAAYLVAGLYDRDDGITYDGQGISSRIEARAKDYYLIVDPAKKDGYSLSGERYIIFNRVKEIFDRLFECNRRVELRLNDEVIGMLDTFPTRVHLEYIAGQSIVYNNTEYEIEHIAEDGRAIYLRRENINFKNCLDTVLLRRYRFGEITPLGEAGVLDSSRGVLSSIRVEPCKVAFTGETYGFYSLMTDRQTLDFYHGVEGNSHVEKPNVRTLTNGRLLRVTLTSRKECTDGMRLMMAAVFNEFVKTIFPSAYHCIAICPVLAEPLPFNEELEAESEVDRIRALYPYVKNADESLTETDPHRMQFLFINDCVEDIGVLDWFYDRSARYMQEFLANIYSYLYWLKRRAELKHYIYFGGEGLPSCYDLEGCCDLLSDFNMVLSDDGKKDFETASDDETEVEERRCSFCHRIMETGRFHFFDDVRFICAECFDTVDEEEKLEEIYDKVRKYMSATYPQIKIRDAHVKLDGIYKLKEDQLLSEYLYRVDYGKRTIYVERDDPANNVAVSILRGLISLWQSDNDLTIAYASAQLYYEELCYLRSIGENESADWIYGALKADLRAKVDEITEFVKSDETPPPADDGATDTDGGEPLPDAPAEEEAEDDMHDDESCTVKTSFLFMRKKAEALDARDEEPPVEEEDDDRDGSSDSLYDPNRVPRFWKRYLRGETIDDHREDDVSDAFEGEDDGDGGDDGDIETDIPAADAPYSSGEITDADETDGTDGTDGDDTDDFVVGEDTELDIEVDDGLDKKSDRKAAKEAKIAERKRKKEEKEAEKQRKKNERDEKKRQKEEKKLLKKRARLAKKGKGADDGDPVDLMDPVDPPVFDPEDIDETPRDTDETPKDDKKKKEDGKKKKKRGGGLFGGRRVSDGERIAPYEDDEATNPKIRIYNELVRRAYDLNEEPFSFEGVTKDEAVRIFHLVVCDYPELFWLDGVVTYSDGRISHNFRCKDASGRLDVRQIRQKQEAIRRGAKPFIKGITRKTDPYMAVLTIYRRLILALDYDGVGLSAGIDKDLTKDDALRSLYSALVEHKVVCAGYAKAMQYLLQSVGIVCGYVISRTDATGGCHAFNMLKIGKYCYYLDATWGDPSNTKSGDDRRDDIGYAYFCVPFSEFLQAGENERPWHYPRDEYYTGLKPFSYTNHEYFRYHNAYLNRYDEAEIVRIFVDAALKYDPDEMGRFTVGFRCYDIDLRKYIMQRLIDSNRIWELIREARSTLTKKKKNAVKYLTERFTYSNNPDSAVVTFYFEGEPRKGKKTKTKS